MEQFDVIGKSKARLDGAYKATAQVRYLDDLVLPGMLWGKVLRSEYAHAKILRIDVSKAERLKGVAAVVTGADVPLVRSGRHLKDRTMFAASKVRYAGDALAAVAAVDLETAERALSLIDVEYEELPLVLDPIQAMDPDAPLVHEDIVAYAGYKPGAPREGYSNNIATFTLIERGDVNKGFAEADYVFEDTYRTHRQANSPLETQGAIASFDVISGKVTIWTTTAAPFRVRSGVCEFLGLPTSKVKIIPSCVGGSFGGKLEAEVEPFCALLAKKVGKPVKIVYMRGEQLRVCTSRHPSVVTLKTGVKKDGTLVAREVRVVFNAGSRANVASLVTAYASSLSAGPYKIPNVKITGYAVYTNDIPGGAFRGFGDPQVCFAYESQMDDIAARLGIDPVDFRLKNAVEEGELMPHGQEMRSVTLKECLSEAVAKSDWREKRAQKRTVEKTKRGVGLACSDGLYGGFASGAIIKVNEDGSVMLSVGATDVGQGSDTALVQIAAEELGVRYEDIQVVLSDTDASPFDIGSFASRVTYHAGNAVKSAASDARRQLFDVAAELLEAKPEDLLAREGKVFVKGSPDKMVPIPVVARVACFVKERSIIGVGSHGCDAYAGPWNVQGIAYGALATNSFAAQVAEVEVDTETGHVKLLKMTAALDCGKAINPGIVEGQIEGGVAIGIGYGLFEELQTPDGRVANGEFKDYLIPTALDIPDIEPIIVEKPQHDGPFGAKGVGDAPPVGVAAAISNAIFDATGVRIKELPITPEKVLKALDEKRGRESEI